MLVITRKPGQGVVIGDVRVEVISVNGKNIRLGIEADENTLILRDEVKAQQTAKASQTPQTATLN